MWDELGLPHRISFLGATQLREIARHHWGLAPSRANTPRKPNVVPLVRPAKDSLRRPSSALFGGKILQRRLTSYLDTSLRLPRHSRFVSDGIVLQHVRREPNTR